LNVNPVDWSKTEIFRWINPYLRKAKMVLLGMVEMEQRLYRNGTKLRHSPYRDWLSASGLGTNAGRLCLQSASARLNERQSLSKSVPRLNLGTRLGKALSLTSVPFDFTVCFCTL
jgi:hypothetical protein